MTSTRSRAESVARDLIATSGLRRSPGEVRIGGGDRDPLPSVLHVGTAAAAAIAAATAGVGAVAEARTGRGQDVRVDLGHAAAAFASETAVTSPSLARAQLSHPLTGNYPTSDGWIRIHANLAPHRLAAARVLTAGSSPTAVRRATRRWKATALADEISAAGGVAAPMRTFAELDTHPQAVAIAGLAPVRVSRGPVAQATDLPPASIPLAGIRVLDLARIVAGPVCGRFLAAYGATVLRVDAPHLEDGERTEADTSIGKRRCSLDLRRDGDRRGFEALVREADVVIHAFRPGAFERLGYDRRVLRELAPTAVIGQLSAYGTRGPWRGCRGFDSVVQVGCGIAHASGFDPHRGPSALPVQALDHASGYLLALGILAGLERRLDAGHGSDVEVSLATTGNWLRSLGTRSRPSATVAPIDRYVTRLPSAHFGRISVVSPPGSLTDHGPRWYAPPVRRGAHPPVWPGARRVVATHIARAG